MHKPRVRILLVEDSPIDVTFIKGLLKASGDVLELEHVNRLTDGIARVALGGIDVVILDLCLPDSAGLDTCSTMRRHFPAVPIVLLTGENDQDLPVEAVRRGAQECLLKDDVNRRKLNESLCLAIERGRSHAGLHQAPAARAGPTPAAGCPCWDPRRRELRVDDLLVKRFKQPAENQELVLAAFEEEHWSAKIDDPLPGIAAVDPKERLRATVRSLNRWQDHRLIRFSCDGTGEGI